MKSFWGWRAFVLCLFISVIVVACAAPSVSHTPPTDLPSITLILRSTSTLAPPIQTLPPLILTPWILPTDTPVIYYAQPEDTLTRIGLNFGIEPVILQTANPHLDSPIPAGRQVMIPPVVATQAPLLLEIAPPTCQPTEPQTLVCLGTITNNREISVGRVALSITLVQDDGQIVAEQIANLEQSHIPPGTTAPYRAAFAFENFDAYPRTQVIVLPLSADPDPLTRRLYPMDSIAIDEHTTQLLQGRYSLELFISAGDLYHPQDLRLVVTVYDAHNLIAGFRVSDILALQADEMRQLLVEIPLLRESDSWRHTVHVESFP